MSNPYFKNPYGIPDSFVFPNESTKDKDVLIEAFEVNGLTPFDFQYEMFGMMVWVLCSNGTLWLLDKSNGGGGVFILEK